MWIQVAEGHYRSRCKRWVILFHQYAGWAVYDSDEFVDVFDSANEAQDWIEQYLASSQEDFPKSA